MKPITEQERQELIEYIKAALAAHVQRGGDSDEEDVFKIALASLTADPFVAVNSVTISSGFVSSLSATGASIYDGSMPRELYAYPPVPVIDFPDSLQDAFEEGNKIPTKTSRCGDRYVSNSFNNWDGYKFIDEFNGFRKGVEYIKRLNGIK